MAIVGIDEVGRGSWAGPLVVAAVILPDEMNGLRDSKLLSSRQRNALAQTIRRNALGIGISWMPAERVDQYGLSLALQFAMKDAVAQIRAPFTQIIIDGNIDYLGFDNVRTIVKADQTIAAVSAASIIAKVARDNYMKTQSINYPGYGFEKHVGYGTTEHRDSLRLQGICDLHRLSFRPVKMLAGA